MNIRMEHMRALGYCRRGIKKFYDQKGWDWKNFLANGTPEEDLINADDAMALKVIEQMRKQNE